MFVFFFTKVGERRVYIICKSLRFYLIICLISQEFQYIFIKLILRKGIYFRLINNENIVYNNRHQRVWIRRKYNVVYQYNAKIEAWHYPLYLCWRDRRCLVWSFSLRIRITRILTELERNKIFNFNYIEVVIIAVQGDYS